MFKRTLAMITGVMLLATTVTDGRAAGLDLDALNLEAGAQLFDPIDPVTVTNLGLFDVNGLAGASDIVLITNEASGAFSLSIAGGSTNIAGTSNGTDGVDFTTMENGSSDLIEILFTVSLNDGLLTDASLILATLTGDFFGSSTDPLTGITTDFNALTDSPFVGSGALTLTAVNQVPLPAGILLLLSALGGLVLVRRRSA